MKKSLLLAGACIYMCTATLLPAFSYFSSTSMSKSNPFAIIPDTATTSLMLDANGGTFEDGTTVKVYEPDTEESLVLYSNGGQFSDGTTMKSYKKDTLTLDAGNGKFEDGTSTKKYEISESEISSKSEIPDDD